MECKYVWLEVIKEYRVPFTIEGVPQAVYQAARIKEASAGITQLYLELSGHVEMTLIDMLYVLHNTSGLLDHENTVRNMFIIRNLEGRICPVCAFYREDKGWCFNDAGVLIRGERVIYRLS